MTKNVYDLIVAIVTGVEVIAGGVCVFLGATGKVDGKTAAAMGSSVTIVGGAVLGVCARFITESVEKKKK